MAMGTGSDIGVGDAIEDGIDRLTTESGLLAIGLFIAHGFANIVIGQTVAVGMVERVFEILEVNQPDVRERVMNQLSQDAPLALDISFEVALVIALLLFVLAALLRVVAIRLLAHTDSKRRRPGVTDNLLSAFAFVFAFEILIILWYGVAFLAPVFIGALVESLALVLLLFIVSFVLIIFVSVWVYFVRQEIALNGTGPLEALKQSYRVTNEQKKSVFLLLAVVFAAGFVVSIVLNSALGSGTASQVVSTLVNRTISVAGIAICTAAFLQTGR